MHDMRKAKEPRPSLSITEDNGWVDKERVHKAGKSRGSTSICLRFEWLQIAFPLPELTIVEYWKLVFHRN